MPNTQNDALFDNITTIPANAVGEQIGVLLDSQEPALSEAIAAAFDLD